MQGPRIGQDKVAVGIKIKKRILLTEDMGKSKADEMGQKGRRVARGESLVWSVGQRFFPGSIGLRSSLPGIVNILPGRQLLAFLKPIAFRSSGE